VAFHQFAYRRLAACCHTIGQLLSAASSAVDDEVDVIVDMS